MKIVLIAPGTTSIPPNGWGAVESIVWDYYELLTMRGIEVHIANNPSLYWVIDFCNSLGPDVVHIMYDDHVWIAPHLQCPKVFFMSHFAYITEPEFEEKRSGYFHGIFKRAIENQNSIRFNAISPMVRDIYVKHGFHQPINIVTNGARADQFRYTDVPQLKDRSVYIAKIEVRKAQYKYQSIDGIDFVGNFHDSSFDRGDANYLGEWTKSVLYDRLTDYGNLVLLSEGEADPLVVKEALIAGLGVVVSECSSANLDLTKPFITVVPNNRLDDLEYVKRVIEENRMVSVENRAEIRDYALANFDWNVVLDRFLELCQ
jgi:glycosyltransferase involved in cell wall biosynthesis